MASYFVVAYLCLSVPNVMLWWDHYFCVISVLEWRTVERGGEAEKEEEEEDEENGRKSGRA